MVTLWNTLIQFKNVEVNGDKPLLTLLVEIEKNGLDEFLLWSGSYNTEAAYVSTAGNILTQWGALIILMIAFAVIAIIALKFIDRDKR